MRQLYIGRWLKGFRKFYEIGQRFNLSPEAQYRLNVIGYYFNNGKNACATARHFGLHRNTVGRWLKLYDPGNLHLLEPKKPAPIRTYRKTTPEHIVQKVIEIKKKYPFLGKKKIQVILERIQIYISDSTIGRIIKKFKLTYLWRTQKSACKFKKRIKKRKKKKRPPKNYFPKKKGEWIQIDTVKIQFCGQAVYVICGVDLKTRFAFAYAYKRPSSANARDYLNKLKLFFSGHLSIKMVQTDNGSEFMKYFAKECEDSGIKHVHSYPKMPKMNAYVESFNGIIQRECLEKADALADLDSVNIKILEYLRFYNFERPHGSIDYQVPAVLYLFDYTNNSTLPQLHQKMWTHSVLKTSI